jgi:hypothetical protein
MSVDSLVVRFYPCGRTLLEHFVSRVLCYGPVVVLTVALMGILAMAMPTDPASAPLGVVLQADRAHVGADITFGGMTIYEGDRLETLDDGTLRARLGGSQLYLRPSTSAEVHGLSNGFSASLMHGTVVVSSPEGQTFQLLANGATIRPVGTQATVVQVSWINANELLLTSKGGAIEVSMEGEVKTIEPGNSYRMAIQPEDSGPQGKGGHPPEETGPAPAGRRRRVVFFIIVGGVAAATGVGVWRALVSPGAP